MSFGIPLIDRRFFSARRKIRRKRGRGPDGNARRRDPIKNGPSESPVHTKQSSAEKLISLPIFAIIVLVMGMDELKKRKTPRYQSFDYNSVGDIS